VNVLHHHLEAVEATSLRSLDLSHEALSEVFENDTVGGGEESKDVLDEMFLVVIQFLPVLNVLGEIDFLSGPESGFLVLVHLPDVVVLDGEENKAVRVLLKKRLLELGALSLRGSLQRGEIRFDQTKFQTFGGLIKLTIARNPTSFLWLPDFV
jgi:hypothetical protein